VAHFAFCVMNFWNYVPPTELYGLARPLVYLVLGANFLSESIASKTPYQTLVGLVLLACFLGAAAWALWISVFRRRPLDRGAAVFLGVASFVVLEAAITAYARVNTGSAERYATPAIAFALCMLGFSWRIAAQIDAYKQQHMLRTCVTCLTMCIIVLANLPRYETFWRNHVAYIEGPYAQQALEPTSLAPWIIEPVNKMKELHLGPFR
jgi:hypothetical protein